MGELEQYYKWHEWEYDEEASLKQSKCWMINVPYSLPVRKPLGCASVVEHADRHHVAAERFSWPGSKGLQWKYINGFLYLGVPLTTEEERKQREPVFREKIRPYIEDFEAEWRGRLLPEVVEQLERLKRVELEKLNNAELRDYLWDWLTVGNRIIDIHFEIMGILNPIYAMFSEMCHELIGIDQSDLQFKTLMSGFDNKAYEVDKGLWRLADRAKGLKLEPLFQATPDDEQLLFRLEESGAGRKWLGELHEFLNEHGWRCERLCDASIPSWVEKPAMALSAIKANMAKGGVFTMDQERTLLVREREKAEKEILSRVPQDKRSLFEKLMRAAQWAGPWSEEHAYYIDLCYYALGRRMFMEIARRCVQAGLLDDPDDINFLNFDEIKRMLPALRLDLRERIRIRRKQWQEFTENAPKMMAERFIIGDPSVIAQWGADPIVAVVAAIPIVKPELKADLYGGGSAPGVIEGTARVVMSEPQLSEIKPEEILVTPSTNTYFTPFFGIVKGVVTDGGGAMSHAVIVSREYGIPCVAGTMEGTKKIKTGMKIRVDGDNGAVYILKE
jgi:pyruvate,water dikinase